jgi:hypothetical protein
MDFLKQHYEKILLTLVLLILAAAAAWLPFAISQERQELADLTGTVPRAKEYKPVDLAPYQQALQALASPPQLSLAGHNLFNPVPWKLKSDGTYIKIASGNEEGPGALVVNRITPLHLTISFRRKMGSSYEIGIHNENVPKPQPNPSPVLVGFDARQGRPTVKEEKGTEDNPTLVLELAGGETVEISKDQPFRRVLGYAADLRYDLENRNFPRVREGDSIVLGGERYKVVAITPSQVRLESVSTTKPYNVRLTGAP